MEEEANVQKQKRENERKGDTIENEYCNELKCKANINRHKKTYRREKPVWRWEIGWPIPVRK